MEEIEKVEIVQNTVEYSQPKFWHTIVARFIDLFIFFLSALIIFSVANTIVVSTAWHKDADNRCNQIRLDSTLFYKDLNGELKFINEFIDTNVNYPTYTAKVETFLVPVIETSFPAFLESECGADVKEKYLTDYKEFKKNIKNQNGVNYFISSGDDYVQNPAIYASENMKDYYNNVYTVFLKDYAQGYLVTYHKVLNGLTSELSFIFFVVEIPLCLFVAFILTYFVPPLFFKRGRKTLGSALYKISLMDERLLSPTFPRFLARTAIVFGVFAVSIFTFGIPLLLSFTLKAFSKMHQNFADYMLKIVEIDSSKTKVYLTYDEAKISELSDHKKPVDFKMERPL